MEPIEHNNVMNSSSGGLIPLVELMNTTHTAGIIQPKVHNDLIKNVPVAENKTSTESLIDTNTSAYNNNFSKQNTVSTDTYKPLQGEITMAEVDTMMLSNQHSDIRFEQQAQAHALALQSGQETNEIVKEGLKATAITDNAVKDARYDISSRVSEVGSRTDLGISSLADRFFTVARDTADLRAQVIQAIDTTKMATELNALKGIIEGQKNTTYLADKIGSEGERTRALINDLKYNDLNRELIDRNTALIEAAGDGRYWRHRGVADQNQAQFASLQNQLQAFNSQLTETRQGMVNFGTMAGVGQSSTSNNVR